jgi:hypothetical protein
MTNEQYLIVSYFVGVILSVALATSVYLFLRRPLAGVAEGLSGKHIRTTLKRLFPLGLLFPALLGFISVSYQSCGRNTYEKIIHSRSYLIEKSQEQISSALLSIVVAILFWDVVVLLMLKYGQTRKKGAS